MSTSIEASGGTEAPPARTKTPKSFTLPIVFAGAASALIFGLVGAQLRSTAPLVILTFGGIALAVCGITLYRVIEPMLRPAAWAARTANAQASVRMRELEREKQLVLKAIREIEHDFQMRKISEADHKELTHRYRTRAMRLIREIDAGDDFRGLIEAELKTRLAARQSDKTDSEKSSSEKSSCEKSS